MDKIFRDDALPESFEKFKHENPEQFTSLCLMHLSFCLDLSDNKLSTLLECKSATNELKAKCKNYLPWRNQKSNGTVSNSPLSQECQYQISQLIQYLGRDKNVVEEWIFRKSGSKSREEELQRHLKERIPINMDDNTLFSVHDCAALLKHILEKLTEPLLTEAFYPYLLKIPDMRNEKTPPQQKNKAKLKQMKTIQLLLMLLPMENYYLLRDLLMLLKKVSVHSGINLMNSECLATIFAPHIICRKKSFIEDMQADGSKIISSLSFMIENVPDIFNVPNELVMDVARNYKPIATSKQDYESQIAKKNGRKRSLNEEDAETTSSDSSAIETTVAFCDRLKSAAYSPSDYTAKAIRQLQADLENMPDSAKKKRLVKQFNENGLGTPVMNQQRKARHQRSRSLGGAIRRQFRRRKVSPLQISPLQPLQNGTYKQRNNSNDDDCWESQVSTAKHAILKPFSSDDNLLDLPLTPIKKLGPIRASKRIRVKKMAERKTILPSE